MKTLNYLLTGASILICSMAFAKSPEMSVTRTKLKFPSEEKLSDSLIKEEPFKPSIHFALA